MKLRSAIAALAVVGLALSGCGGDDDGDESSSGIETPSADATGTLKVWVMPDVEKFDYDRVTAKFNEAYPNVTVTVEPQVWGGIQDKLTTALGTDSTPDVVELGNSFTAKYIDAGLLADLSEQAGDLGIEGMLPGLLPSGEYDGTRAGVPFYGGVRLVVYKKSDFAKAGITAVPTSLAELEDAASKLQAANAANPNYSAFYFPGKNWYGAVPFVWDAGGEIAEDDSGNWTGTLNSDDSQAGLATLKNLVDNYSKAPKDGLEDKNVAAFNTGNVGMMIDSWWAPDALDTAGEPFAGDIGAFAIPGTAAGSTSPVYFGGSDIAISEQSPNKGLALEYVKIFTGSEIQTEFAASPAGIIPNQEAAFVGHEGKPFLQVADEASTNSRFTPVSPYWGNVETSNVLQDMLVSIFTEAATIDEATAAADERVSSILNGGS